MNNNGPILIIEDNVGAQNLFKEVYTDLKYINKIEFFNDGEKAFRYLKNCQVIPFLILSNVNMPSLDGFSLKAKINKELPLNVLSIPFIFFSTAASINDVNKAFQMSSQGFFTKPATIAGLEKVIKTFMEYWLVCIAPHDFL